MISLLATKEFKDYPNRYYDAAVQSLLPLQNGCYEPRWEIVPQQGDTLAARGKRTMQVRLEPGSYIYRLEVNGLVFLQIEDDGSGLAMFSQPVQFSGLLPRPFYTEKGALTIDFFSQSAAAQTAQVALYVIEPVGGFG